MTHFSIIIQNNEAPDEQANNEEITLSEGDSAVIMYLRQHYLKLGQPSHVWLRPRDPDKKFIMQGGNKYLRLLFACGPMMPGNRLVNLRKPGKPYR